MCVGEYDNCFWAREGVIVPILLAAEDARLVREDAQSVAGIDDERGDTSGSSGSDLLETWTPSLFKFKITHRRG